MPKKVVVTVAVMAVAAEMAAAVVVVMRVLVMRVKVTQRVPRAMAALKARKPITTAGLFETMD
ncbi:hypothetical protein KRR23_09555 [Pseudomonas sp. CVAP|nr:hypothetical protein [Pseudomonas sp. CVAP\